MIPTITQMLECLDKLAARYQHSTGIWWSNGTDEIFDAIRILIERAEDVDRLVEAAKEYIEAVDCTDKVPAEKYVRRVRGGQQGLRDALVPFKEKK